MSLRSVAREHYRARARLARNVELFAARLWRRIDRADIAGSWGALAPQLLVALTAAQVQAATPADAYLAAVLAEQGLGVASEGRLNVSSLAGVASDGRELDVLLNQPVLTSLTSLSRGHTLGRSLASGEAALRMTAATQVADAGRVADQVAMTARRGASGYRRMLVGGSCSRCVILAGRWYRWNAGFDRHPKCLPAGTVVSGPGVDGATRRWYQGELVVIRTAGGKNLAVTGNHPVLTSQGWLPANLLREGGDVVGRADGDRSGALLVPDHDQMPARIEDLWRSDGMSSLGRMPVAAEDFHGDGFGSGHVDVVLADRFLRYREQVSALQELGQVQLALRSESAVPLPRSGTYEQFGLGSPALPDGAVSCSGLFDALGLGHLASADDASLAWSSDGHATVHEALADHGPADIEALRQGVLALACEIGGHDGGAVDFTLTPRWDAPPGPFAMESRAAYASRGEDLRFRLAGKVEVDRVVELRRVEWSGHVYNLTSREGWYDANGIIVSNCDCIHVPAAEDTADDIRTDPKKYFDSLSREEQDRVFTKAGAESVRLGADINQVVNVRRGARGLTTAGARLTGAEARLMRGGRERGRLEAVDVYGRQLFVTTEGVTVRGVAGVRLGARETGVKAGGRYRSAKTPRLMPESILQIAGGDRDEAIRLLKRFGFIL